MIAFLCLFSCAPKEAIPNTTQASEVSFDLDFFDANVNIGAGAACNDTTALFKSRIGQILQDSKGNHWISTQKEGVFLYDGQKLLPIGQEQIDKQVRKIHEHTNGDIWLGIDSAVLIYDGRSLKRIELDKGKTLLTKSFSYTKENFDRQWTTHLGEMRYSAFSQNGIYHFDGKRLRHLTLPVPQDYPAFDEKGYHPDQGWDRYAVYGIYQDRRQNIWFGTSGAGIFRFDGKEIICINEGRKKGVVRAIQEDQEGKIWFGNNANGINTYDGQSVTNFSELRKVYTQGLQGALDMIDDTEGNLWMATYDAGLWRYTPQADVMPKFPLSLDGKILQQFTTKDGLNSNYVSVVHQDHDGKIWVGTGYGGVYILDGERFNPLSITN
ncbi:MAG: two-component regulator propeller domain-containing protein [Bacteroidota bacterium]